MWRQDDLLQIYNRARLPAPYDLTRGTDGIREQKAAEGPGRVVLPASPLMHGTGLLTGLMTLVSGGSVITLALATLRSGRDARRRRSLPVEGTAIVGDAFARPLVEALDANPGRWDISSLLGITSSGVMWSEEVKRGLLRHHPTVILRDALGSSESIGMANSESTGAAAERTAKFKLGDFATVLDDAGKPVVPGSGVIGRIAVRGNLPVGYYKDEEKSARTFIVYDGVRWSIPGDYATVEADGSIALLGRGSVCINTGGEKVFPEEVEEALKSHPEVRDAVCVGVPDTRFGEAITAMVEPADGHRLAEAELISWVKERLAHYKAPEAGAPGRHRGPLAVGEGRLQGPQAARARTAGDQRVARGDHFERGARGHSGRVGGAQANRCSLYRVARSASRTARSRSLLLVHIRASMHKVPTVRYRLGHLAFAWDAAKAETNVRTHGVAFEEAATTWLDPRAIERFDEEHASDEDRWLRIGASIRGALLVVWSSERPAAGETLIRIIGARRAHRKERDLYDQQNERR